jgi:hydroxylamine reductase (hybrid-cluster protein)
VEGKKEEEETRVDETQTAINFSQLQALFVWTRKGVAVRCVSAVPNRKINQQTNKREREKTTSSV